MAELESSGQGPAGTLLALHGWALYGPSPALSVSPSLDLEQSAARTGRNGRGQSDQQRARSLCPEARAGGPSCLQRGILSSSAGHSAGCGRPGKLPSAELLHGSWRSSRICSSAKCQCHLQAVVWPGGLELHCQPSSTIHQLGDVGQVLGLSVLDFYLKNWNDSNASKYHKKLKR